ncbi:hypothetical protein ACFLYR_08715 [Chloroflexota bacterium]
MKKKTHKILGLALTLTLLASLVLGAAPVAADELEWGKLSMPRNGSDGDWFWDVGITGVGPMAIAIDGTMYAYVAGTDMLAKSTDGGRKWSKVTKYTGGAVVDIAVSSEDADVFYVADVNSVISYTTNAGSTFHTLPANALMSGTEAITAVDIGYDGGDVLVFMSTADPGAGWGGVYFLSASYGSDWADQKVGNATHGTMYDVLDIRTSPNFADESNPQTVAVVTSATQTLVTYKYGSAQWDSTVDDALVQTGPTTAPVDFVAQAAAIDFPDDYDSDKDSDGLEFFIAVDSATAVGDPSDGIYRIVVSSDFQVEEEVDCYSLAVAGSVGDASLLVGTTDGTVHYSTNNGDTWTKTKKAPTGGTNVFVLMADDFLDSEEAFAGAMGTGTAALSITHDGGTLFNQIALISTVKRTIESMSFTPDYGSSGALFVVTRDQQFSPAVTNSTDSLWKYDPDSKVWERVAFGDIDKVQVSRDYLSDESVFYAGSVAAIPMIYRSTDGGMRFKAQLDTPAEAWFGWRAIDSSTLIVGATNAVYLSSNNGTTWTKKTSGLTTAGMILTFALSPDYDSDETMLCGGVGKVFLSTNDGSTWKSQTAGDEKFDTGDGPVYVAFHPDFADNETFFGAGDDAGDDIIISRFTGEWDVIYDGLEPGTVIAGDTTGLVVAGDGTLYATHADGDYKGMFRSLNPTTSDTSKVSFELVSEDAEYALGLLQMTAGSNILWGNSYNWSGTAWTSDVWAYEDTLTGSATLSSPSDGSDTGREDSATLSWNEMDGADLYDIWVDTDPGFKTDPIKKTTELSNLKVSGLEDGQTYYWKVRVSAGEPVKSNWSSVWSFSTALGAPQWNPFVGGVPESPVNGATNLSLTPTFAWNAADWSTGYEFVLAKDAAFSDAVVSKTGANALTATVYLSEETLANSTTYYWKVRAISKTTNSEWATAVFTTEAKAPAPPAPPVTPTPTPVDTGTPMYIWVIIGIGAALVIAVIILIVRTRRVA